MRFSCIQLQIALLLLTIACEAQAKSISFDQATAKALNNSYDLKLDRIDTDLARNKVKEARVPYYPTLNGSVNAEYVGGLGNPQNIQNQSPVVVGNAILPGNTRFQNAMSLSTNYTIFDFGGRANQLRAAKKHVQGMLYQQKTDTRDLRLAVLDAYLQTLLNYKEIQYKQEQLKLQELQYLYYARLFKAGKVSRVDVGEREIAKTDYEKELQDLRLSLGAALNKLAALTHDHYSVDNIELDELEPEVAAVGAPVFPNPLLPDFKSYEMLIQEKRAEMNSIKAQRYPQVSLFGSFVLYGANQNSWFGSLGDLKARQIYFGIGTNIPVFDGFKTSVAIQQKKLEITRLETEREKRLWELRKDFERSATDAALYGVEMKTTARLLSNSQEQLGLIIRLTVNQIMDKTKEIDEQIDLLGRKLQADKVRLQRIAAAKRMKIYLEV